jgi:hypothetical protein
MTNSERLRELAAWYREFAEKTENPWIWAARLRTAKALEAEARFVNRKDKPRAEDLDPACPDLGSRSLGIRVESVGCNSGLRRTDAGRVSMPERGSRRPR